MSLRRLNWRESAAARKRGLDAALARYREGPRPSIDAAALAFACALIACAVVALYLCAYQEGGEDQKARADRLERQLLDCMNGRATWSHPNTTSKGYGRTLVVCRGAEEFQI